MTYSSCTDYPADNTIDHLRLMNTNPLFYFFFQVAVCANCNQTTTYGAFVIGIGGGIFYMIFTWGVLKLKVDDPLDATAGTFLKIGPLV